jgi:hypothetical protein
MTLNKKEQKIIRDLRNQVAKLKKITNDQSRKNKLVINESVEMLNENIILKRIIDDQSKKNAILYKQLLDYKSNLGTKLNFVIIIYIAFICYYYFIKY